MDALLHRLLLEMSSCVFRKESWPGYSFFTSHFPSSGRPPASPLARQCYSSARREAYFLTKRAATRRPLLLSSAVATDDAVLHFFVSTFNLATPVSTDEQTANQVRDSGADEHRVISDVLNRVASVPPGAAVAN